MRSIVVYDNGGQTIDRYTIVIDSSVYGMSSNALAPNGFNQYAGELSDFTSGLDHCGHKVRLASLPPDVVEAISRRRIAD